MPETQQVTVEDLLAEAGEVHARLYAPALAELVHLRITSRQQAEEITRLRATQPAQDSP